MCESCLGDFVEKCSQDQLWLPQYFLHLFCGISLDLSCVWLWVYVSAPIGCQINKDWVLPSEEDWVKTLISQYIRISLGNISSTFFLPVRFDSILDFWTLLPMIPVPEVSGSYELPLLSSCGLLLDQSWFGQSHNFCAIIPLEGFSGKTDYGLNDFFDWDDVSVPLLQALPGYRRQLVEALYAPLPGHYNRFTQDGFLGVSLSHNRLNSCFWRLRIGSCFRFNPFIYL